MRKCFSANFWICCSSLHSEQMSQWAQCDSMGRFCATSLERFRFYIILLDLSRLDIARKCFIGSNCVHLFRMKRTITENIQKLAKSAESYFHKIGAKSFPLSFRDDCDGR